MKRRSLLKALGTIPLLFGLPRAFAAATAFSRTRPSDAAWPAQAEWQRLNEAVGGNLHPVDFPLDLLKANVDSAASKKLLDNLKNPYFIDDTPGLTQTSGWVDAWASQPSVYAVAARSANDVAAAINFAREHNLRLAVKGAGHSYQGTSNAPDSLLIWTHHMDDIEIHDTFVPQGCDGTVAPQPAVSLGAGAVWMHAYEEVTGRAGRYVQGGGCSTVGVAGLIQSGGFGSHSKHYGTAAAALLEAEVVTADGQVRIANACINPDLFWALKGGGGGTFGVITRLTVRTFDLPEYFPVANVTVTAKSDTAYRRLIGEFMAFYKDNLFNDHWGEQARFRPDNKLVIQMVGHGLSPDEAKAVWQPFLDKVKHASDWSVSGLSIISAVPAREFWNIDWWKAHWPELLFPRDGTFHSMIDSILVHILGQPVYNSDPRPGASPGNNWSKGDGEQAGQFLWAYESLWLSQAMLSDDNREALTNAMFEASRHWGFSLHFNKGLAGAPGEAIATARDTATNPAVLDAFALAISANGEGFAYPGVKGHEPDVDAGRESRQRVASTMKPLRAVTGSIASYVSESNFFEPRWQESYWGSNYPRLATIKAQYDPDGLFIVHNGVGAEAWTPDGFTKK